MSKETRPINHHSIAQIQETPITFRERLKQ
jgi:hypothetical protein